MARTLRSSHLARQRSVYTNENHATAAEAITELGLWHGPLPDARGEQQVLEALALVVLCQSGLIDAVTMVSPRADRIYLTTAHAGRLVAALLGPGGVPWLAARPQGSGLDLYRRDRPGLIHIRHAAHLAPHQPAEHADDERITNADHRGLYGVDVEVASRILRRLALFPAGRRASLAAYPPDSSVLAGPHPQLFVPRGRPPVPPMIGWYSQTGDTGTTSTMMQVARALADAGSNILVVDLDKVNGPLAGITVANPRVPTELYQAPRGGRVSARYLDARATDVHLAQVASAGRYDLVFIDAGTSLWPRLRDAGELDHLILCLRDVPLPGTVRTRWPLFTWPAEQPDEADDDEALDRIDAEFHIWLTANTDVAEDDLDAQDERWWDLQELRFAADPDVLEELDRQLGSEAPYALHRWQEGEAEDLLPPGPEWREGADIVALIAGRALDAKLPLPSGIVACRSAYVPDRMLLDEVAAGVAPAFLAAVPHCPDLKTYSVVAAMVPVYGRDGRVFDAAINSLAEQVKTLAAARLSG